MSHTHSLASAIALAVALLGPFSAGAQIKPVATEVADGDTMVKTTVTRGSKPVNVVARTYAGNPNVEFTWTGTDGAASYILQRAPSPTSVFLDVYNQPATSMMATDATGIVGATQYYRVIAKYGLSGYGGSDIIAVTIPTALGVTELVATSPNPGTVVLRWRPDPLAAGYRISRAKMGEAWLRIVDTPPLTESTYTDSGLWIGGSYIYLVTPIYGDPRVSGRSREVGISVTP